VTARVVVPRGVVVAEIEFAIAYTRAANPDRDLLGADRRLFAEAIVDMLFERAEHGISGMRIEDDGHGG
jgi:hypothetical protein